MEFTIALPERFRLSDLQVCLKSLILPSRIWNIYDETMPMWKITTYVGENEGGYKNFRFPQGSYEVEDILKIMQTLLDTYKVPVEISFNHDIKQVRMKLKTEDLKTKDEAYSIGIVGLSVGQDEYASGHFDLFSGVEIENSIAEVTRIVARPISVACSKGPFIFDIPADPEKFIEQSLLDSMDE